MSDLPGYDEWKTHNPEDDRCEYCGAYPSECRGGWAPSICTGECGRGWRDPDFERDQARDDEMGPQFYYPGEDDE
jgi:hypothetical protein